jgi:hypothetical protein
MNMERIQEEFESWVRTGQFPELNEAVLKKLPDGNYASQITHASWMAWKGANQCGVAHGPVVEEIKKRLDAATRDTGLRWAYESCGGKGDGSNVVGTMFHPDDLNAKRPLLGRCDPIYDEAKREFKDYYRDEEVAEIGHRTRNANAVAEFISHAPTDMDALLTQVSVLRSVLEGLVEVVPEPPERNCSCHVAPPCGDCVMWGGLREALENARTILKETE